MKKPIIKVVTPKSNAFFELEQMPSSGDVNITWDGGWHQNMVPIRKDDCIIHLWNSKTKKFVARFVVSKEDAKDIFDIKDINDNKITVDDAKESFNIVHNTEDMFCMKNKEKENNNGND